VLRAVAAGDNQSVDAETTGILQHKEE
jgi:hypothetical protein